MPLNVQKGLCAYFENSRKWGITKKRQNYVRQIEICTALSNLYRYVSRHFADYEETMMIVFSKTRIVSNMRKGKTLLLHLKILILGCEVVNSFYCVFRRFFFLHHHSFSALLGREDLQGWRGEDGRGDGDQQADDLCHCRLHRQVHQIHAAVLMRYSCFSP